MTAKPELERRLSDYYSGEVSARAPDRVLHAALASIDITPQRRVLRLVPWRFHTMNTFARAAIAAVAVVVVGAGVLAVIGPGRGSGPGGVANPTPPRSPSLAPSPSAPPTPSPSPLPALTGSFTSSVFGVSSAYPAGWTVRPAAALWTSGLPPSCTQACADRISENPSETRFLDLVSQPLGGKAAADWVAGILAEPGIAGSCAPTTESISIDGSAGVLATTCPDGALVALTTAGGRGYLIAPYGIDDVGQFKEILATVKLRPQDAKDVMPSPAPS